MTPPQLPRLCEPSIELVLICSQGGGTIPPQPREEVAVHLEPRLLASTLQRLDGRLCTPLWHLDLPTQPPSRVPVSSHRRVGGYRATREDVT